MRSRPTSHHPHRVLADRSGEEGHPARWCLHRYTYDAAHRLTDIADNAGNTIHYTLDNAGNRTQEDTKDRAGAIKRTLSRVYNQLGQLPTQADAGQPTDFTYDANGNTDTVTDALSRVTDNDYDPLNRLSAPCRTWAASTPRPSSPTTRRTT